MEPPSPYMAGGGFFLHPEGGLVHSHNSGKFQLSSSINFEDGQGPPKFGGFNPTGAIVGVQNWVI